MKRTLKFDNEWKQAISLLPKNMQKKLTDAVILYQQTGELTELPPIARAIFLLIKSTVDRRAASAARQRERRMKASAAKAPKETREERNKRIGCTLKQNRRYLRWLSRRFNIAHNDIKSGIDRVISSLNDSGTTVPDTETFIAHLLAHLNAA